MSMGLSCLLSLSCVNFFLVFFFSVIFVIRLFGSLHRACPGDRPFGLANAEPQDCKSGEQCVG